MTFTKKLCLIVSVVCLTLAGGIFMVSEAKTSKKEEPVAVKTAAAVTDEAEDDASVTQAGKEEENKREIFAFDASTSTIAYLDTIDQETFDTFVENLNKNWSVGVNTKEQFIADHPEIFGGYVRDENGKLLVPWSDAQMINRDSERQNAAKGLGLETQPINDALDFPNAELTESDVKAIKAASYGQAISLEKDLKDYEVAIFKDWLSKPVVFEAFINLMLDQKIGSEFTLRDSWTGPTQFTEAYDKAREDGEGVNHWIRCFEDKEGNQYFYTSEEYIYDYVIPFISFVYECPFSCEVLSSNEHYHLVAGDNDILRKAELANYRDGKTAFVWRFLLKDNTVGLLLGDNVRDGRPEILNYTIANKEEAPKTVTKKTTTRKTTPTPTPTPSTSSGGGSSTKNDSTPTPEVKHPSQGSASQGNASVGGGTNDNSGSGTWKPDAGNSQSPTVDGSQAHAGTATNTDGGNSENYDQGPAADNTDNGATPDTSAPENQVGTGEGVNNSTVVDNSTGATTETTAEPPVRGEISAPAVDDFYD